MVVHHIYAIIRNETNVKFTVKLTTKNQLYYLCRVYFRFESINHDLRGFNSAKLVNYYVNRNNNSFKAYEQEGAER